MKNKKEKKSLKEKIYSEFTEYIFNFIYMAIFFSAIILYRRMVLAQHGIILEDYFMGVIKAMVIAKVVMIGTFMRISRKYEHKALIIPTLYKSLLFTILVILFDIIEISIRALIHEPNLMNVLTELNSHLNLTWLGGAMLIFFIFIPFFSFMELSRIIGKEKIKNLFLRNDGDA